MAITDPNSVLILGAGVSVPFGLPTGEQLMNELADDVSTVVDSAISRDRNSGRVTRTRLDPNELYLRAFGPDDSDMQKTLGLLQLLAVLLVNQTSDSIDDFIVMNSKLAGITKWCIAVKLFRCMYTSPGNSPHRLNTLDRRNLDYSTVYYKGTPIRRIHGDRIYERNWIHRLINLVRLGIAQKTVSRENKIRIITFNYDPILEHVLELQFSNTDEGPEKYPDYKKFIDIRHMHGQFERLTEQATTSDAADLIKSWADSIFVVREVDEDAAPTQIKQDREKARNWVVDADNMYACGFAFAKANTDLLRLGPGAPPLLPQKEEYPPAMGQKQDVYCYNHGNSIGVRMAVENLATKGAALRTRVVDHSYTEGQNLSDWIGVGNLGEMP